MQDITALKQDFQKTADPETRCKDQELLLSQECERLVFKGMEHLYINATNSAQGEKRHLTEKIMYLEQQLQTHKSEALKSESSYSIKMSEIES